LIVTMSFDVVALKWVPVIVTIVPTGPLVGDMLVIVGAGTNVKLLPLVPVKPLAVTVIGPVDALAGTVAVNEVALAAVTVPATPLNLTLFAASVAPKFVPVRVTEVPAGPLEGVKPVIAGVTLKLLLLVPVNPLAFTAIAPVVTPAGAVTVSEVELAAVTVAATPLKVTVFAAGVLPKFTPVIVTVVPGDPPVGVNVEIAGATVKLPLLVTDA
jgi:hypothetical protein